MKVINASTLIFHLYHFCLTNHFPTSTFTFCKYIFWIFLLYFFSVLLLPFVLSANTHTTTKNAENFLKKEQNYQAFLPGLSVDL